MGGPTSSYANAGIALRISGALNSHRHDNGGDTIGGVPPALVAENLDFISLNTIN
jgi:hypothetical protein